MCGRVTKKGMGDVRLGLGLGLGAGKCIHTTLSAPNQFSESKVRHSQNSSIINMVTVGEALQGASTFIAFSAQE